MEVENTCALLFNGTDYKFGDHFQVHIMSDIIPLVIRNAQVTSEHGTVWTIGSITRPKHGLALCPARAQKSILELVVAH